VRAACDCVDNPRFPSGTEVRLQPTFTDFDEPPPGNMWKLLPKPWRLTAKVAGKYQISGGAVWQGNPYGFRQLSIVLNSESTTSSRVLARVKYGASPDAPNEGPPETTAQIITTLWNMKKGDYVELFALQNSGNELFIYGKTVAPDTSDEIPGIHFEMVRVGPASE